LVGIVRWQTKALEFVFVEEEEGDCGKSDPPVTFLSVLQDIDTVSNYLMQSDVDDKMMATLSNDENEVYRV
jgi:hypothetical protein